MSKFIFYFLFYFDAYFCFILLFASNTKLIYTRGDITIFAYRNQSYLFLILFLFLFFFSLKLTAWGLPLERLPGWAQDHQSESIPALLQSCLKEDLPKNFCTKLNKYPNLSDAQMRKLLSTYFIAEPILPNQHRPSGLFTGYYAPSISGSLTESKNYPIPIYGRPQNLVSLEIHHHVFYKIKKNGHYLTPPSRAEIIHEEPLSNTPIIAWAHSRVDRFFLQIQGSGVIRLTHGKNLFLGYAGQNGQKYYPIGAHLLAIGALNQSDISMQSIKHWLDTHPSQAQSVMDLNPSFVFFRKMPIEGFMGAHGTELTPERSLAVDPKFNSLGTPLWLVTTLPSGKSFDQLMVAQDTGGAIKGRVRGDIFFGMGEQAESLAGHMQAPGLLWNLVPKI